MRRKGGRLLVGIASAALLGSLYQTSCINFAAAPLQGSIDFCFLFDCSNGAFGGLVNFCPDQTTDTSSDGTVTNGNIFVDCPIAAQ